MSQKSNQKPGTERARDEKREDRGPVYGGQKDWNVADERGDDRFGVARNDDADPSELIGRAHGPVEQKSEDGKVTSSNVEDEGNGEESQDADEEARDVEDTEIESGGERAGMGRGEQPRKAKRREKP